VATVSPADICFAETLSTLKFAQRAKSIKNAAVVNEETRGSVVALQNEILFLKTQIADFHARGVSIISDVDSSNDVPSNHKDAELLMFIKSKLDVTKEYLDRCEVAEERKARCESEVKVLSKRLAETEKSVLSTKMKLKMRDAEVKRLKSKDPAALAEYQSTEELLRVDVDAARQEMQAEVVRYKMMYEELQRRQEKYEAECIPAWVDSQEVKFNHELLQTLLALEAKVEDVAFKSDCAAHCDFQNACGISIEEALDVRENYFALKSTVEELRIANDASSMAISNAFNTIRELENSGSEYKLKAEERIAELEGMHEEQTAQIASMQEILTAKSSEVEELRAEIKRAEESLRRDRESSESARLMEYNKLMKDNMILLKNTRELQKYATDKENEVKECEDQIVALQQEAEKINMATHARTTQLEARIKELDGELAISNEKVSSQAKSISVLSAEKTECAEKNEECAAVIARLQKDLEKSNFELENSREDADSLYTQAETLMAELEDIKTELGDAYQQVICYTTPHHFLPLF
jgi:chromosome segregation ATPase